MASRHSTSAELRSTFSRAVYLHVLSAVLPRERFLSSPFLASFNHFLYHHGTGDSPLIYSGLSRVWLFFDPMDFSLPGSYVSEISQAIVLERVAISSSRGSSQPRDRTPISSSLLDKFSCPLSFSMMMMIPDGKCLMLDYYRLGSAPSIPCALSHLLLTRLRNSCPHPYFTDEAHK